MTASSKSIKYVFTLTLLAAVPAFAQQPKLIIGIIVDGLKQETLDLLSPHFRPDGFNRFLKDGVVIENVDYGTNLDAAASVALLLTGATPVVNGISSERIYEPEGRRTRSVFQDENALGNFTEETLSPQALKLTTVSDEARIAGAGVTYVYAIAPEASQALLLGSHAGNSAVWFNDNTGNWATSTFYKETPAAILNVNRTNSLKNRLDGMIWEPSPTTAKAAGLPDHLTRYPFKYSFPSKDSERYARFANSPLINDEITALAQEYINGMQLGKHDGTDVLNLGFTLQPFEFSKTAENRYELYDSYIKLDASLAKLLNAAENVAGKDNVVVYISGTPSRGERRVDDEKWNIPGGDFSSRKAVSLLNLYLIALHGNGEWVKSYHNNQFYLNSDLANSLDKDITLLRRQAADFLVLMSGVGHAYTIEDIISANPVVPNALGKSRNTVIPQAGDVEIELIPGWRLIDDYNFIGQESKTVKALTPTTAPFMIKAPQLNSKRIDAPIDARSIAPAIAGLLHIRAPNGANTPAVSFK